MCQIWQLNKTHNKRSKKRAIAWKLARREECDLYSLYKHSQYHPCGWMQAVNKELCYYSQPGFHVCPTKREALKCGFEYMQKYSQVLLRVQVQDFIAAGVFDSCPDVRTERWSWMRILTVYPL